MKLSEIFNRFLAVLICLGIWLRYRVTFRGFDEIKSKRGILFLPNHPAEIDPVIVLSKLWKRFSPKAVVLEDFYFNPGLNWMMKLIGAIPMPNMWIGSGAYKKLRVRQSMDQISENLEKGSNVLLYPSGRMMHSGLEDLRGASAIYEIIQKNSDFNIVLIRTSGLIGSSFSWVANQQRPNQWHCLYHGILHVLKNLVFFTPRRKVLIEFEDLGSGIPKFKDKLELNKWLEDWYNLKGEESATLVSYRFWKKVYFELKEANSPAQKMEVTIREEIRQKVEKELSNKSGIKISEIRDEHSLFKDLGFDSLDLAEVTSWMEEEFHVTGVNAADLNTTFDVMAAANGCVLNSDDSFSLKLKGDWEKLNLNRRIRTPDPNVTIQQNFLDVCDSFRNELAMADETSGVLSYGMVKTRVLLLADIFKTLPNTHIGIMLPASCAATLSIFSCLIAGKIPVMINWTVGDNTLTHIIKVTGLKHIISSGRFLDKIDQLNIELLEPYLITLESLRDFEITFRRKIKAFLRSKMSSKSLAKIFSSNFEVSKETAVILFTSGSETMPKGVPLSHYNILSNIKACITAGEVKPSDSIYAFLPPFHSFGFTVTTILPLMTGLKAAYYPNPLESRKIVQGISGWKPSIICGTPTFVSGIFKAAESHQLQSLRLILVGAEKTPKELFERVKKLCKAEILEGYGITECSPVLSINRPGKGPSGVGPPVGDVEIRILNEGQDTGVERGQRGLIIVRGSNVFEGYLGRDSEDAFMVFEGKKWYITGDLGSLDKENNLWISGRLRRFVKVGGEMISLPAMEEALEKHLNTEDEEQKSALSYLEREGDRPIICLFTVVNIEVEEANKILKKEGFSNLHKINHQIKLDEIPVLGTGKTDHRKLKSILSEKY